MTRILPSIEKKSLMEALDEARGKGEDTYLRFLTSLQDDLEEAKWSFTGKNHRIWARDFAIWRMAHVEHKDIRTPWPLENHIWGLTESVRPIWGDNSPSIEISALKEGFAEAQRALELLWKWIRFHSKWNDWWESSYDFFPNLGTTATKALFDSNAPGGGKPYIDIVDPRAVFYDPVARLNHRFARIVSTKHFIEAGEVISRFPELAKKVSSQLGEGGRMAQFHGTSQDLAQGKDTQETERLRLGIHGAKAQDRLVEVVEMWINPDLLPPDTTALERMKREGDIDAEIDRLEEELIFKTSRPNHWAVISFVPGAGVIGEEEVTTGLQIASGQCWRNPEGPWGFSDVSMVAGLQVAMDQLSIRGHIHRLSIFGPTLKVPRNSGVDPNEFGGRPAAVVQPENEVVSRGIDYLQPPQPDPEVINFLVSRPDVMRRVLGIDEFTTQFFQREQTAGATAIVAAALENRTRQKIRNCKPMVEDMARVLIALTIENLEGEIPVLVGDQFVPVNIDQLKEINLDDFAITSNIGQQGPLSRAARINAIERAHTAGITNPETPVPNIVREVFMDVYEVPRRQEIMAEFRRLEAERKAQEQAILQAAQAQAAAQAGGAPGGAPGGGGQPQQGAPRQVAPLEPAPATGQGLLAEAGQIQQEAGAAAEQARQDSGTGF